MSFSMKLTGDWQRATSFLSNLAKKLKPDFEAQLTADGEFVIQTLQHHIEAQDLGWTPLSPHTVELKGGSKKILVETGQLMNSFEVKKIDTGDFAIYVGVKDTTHSDSGVKMLDLMMWIEYGTDKMVPRPLIQPTAKEVEKIIKTHWVDLFRKELNT